MVVGFVVKLRILSLLLLLTLGNIGPQNVAATLQAHMSNGQAKPKPKPTPTSQSQTNTTRPNIVIILIDDMGFNDVSFHGSNQILTPNMDALAYNGIILNRLYVPNLCTPSRATLLTGKYPHHTGTQHFVIVNDEPWGLPLKERTMPEIFRSAGYSTNLIGKWHLGFYRKEMTPTYRGFDYHYGYYSGYIDYYDHSLKMLDRNYSPGLDFRRNLKPWPQANGSYATEEFTNEAVRVIKDHNPEQPLFLVMSHLAVHTGNEDNPMQAPPEEVEKFHHISNPQRRIYAGMISSLDKSVGRTVQALAQKGILDNTIILLYADNGAPTVGLHANGGSNHPFRGQKESPWEGGIRSAGCIWSPLLRQTGYVSNQQIHSIDWLPTLAAAANVPIPKSIQLDGVNMWETLSNKADPQPRSLVHSLDDNFHYYAYMRDNFKYVNGTTYEGRYDIWLGSLPPEEADPQTPYYVQEVLSSPVQTFLGDPNLTQERIRNLRAEATHHCPDNPEDYTQDIFQCNPLEAACLFDLANDPCERYNLAKLNPLQVAIMERELNQYRLSAVPTARVSFSDPKANPALHRNTWEWWAKSKAPALHSTFKNGLYLCVFIYSLASLLKL